MSCRRQRDGASVSEGGDLLFEIVSEVDGGGGLIC